MRIIGVTGLIGSGKSTVMRALTVCGVACYDCDARAKELMQSSPELREQIEVVFGAQAYVAGQLNRAFLASLIFSDAKLKRALEKVVHPAVKLDVMRWVASQHVEAVAVESALLIESGVDDLVSEIWVVDAPEKVRVERVVARDSLSVEQVASRMAAQMSRDELITHATYVIDNGVWGDVEAKVMALFSKK